MSDCIDVLWEVYSKLQQPVDRATIAQLKKQVEEQCILPNDVPYELKDDAMYYAFEQLSKLEQAIKRLREVEIACSYQGNSGIQVRELLPNNEEKVVGELCDVACNDVTNHLQKYIADLKSWTVKALKSDVLNVE